MAEEFTELKKTPLSDFTRGLHGATGLKPAGTKPLGPKEPDTKEKPSDNKSGA